MRDRGEKEEGKTNEWVRTSLSLSLVKRAKQDVRVGFQNRRAELAAKEDRWKEEHCEYPSVVAHVVWMKLLKLGRTRRGEGSTGCVRRALLVNLARGMCRAVLKRETWASGLHRLGTRRKLKIETGLTREIKRCSMHEVEIRLYGCLEIEQHKWWLIKFR